MTWPKNRFDATYIRHTKKIEKGCVCRGPEHPNRTCTSGCPPETKGDVCRGQKYALKGEKLLPHPDRPRIGKQLRVKN